MRAESPEPPAEGRGGGGVVDLKDVRVLCVEDDFACASLVRKMLARCGADTRCVPSSEDAFALLSLQQFDIVVSDIRLPGIDGVAFLGRVRRQYPSIPVVLMTGYASVETSVNALRMGAADYIVKPFRDQDEMPLCVWRTLSHARLQQVNRDLESKLLEGEEIFRALFENANDAMFLQYMDGRGVPGVFAKANNRACVMLGYDERALKSMDLHDMVAEEHRWKLDVELRTIAEKESATFEVLLRGKSGAKTPVEISAHLFALNGRKALLSLVRDISARRDIERQLADVTERERRQVGIDLHDDICQDFASIDMLAGVLRGKLGKEFSTGLPEACLVGDLAQRGLAACKRLAAGLLAIELERDGLQTALSQMAADQERISGVRFSFEASGNVAVADETVARHVYRIAQEAVNNAVRHANATRITVALAEKSGEYSLRVEDDGKGLHIGPSGTGGMGLQIMRYRASVIGGSLDVSSRLGCGTSVTCTWR